MILKIGMIFCTIVFVRVRSKSHENCGLHYANGDFGPYYSSDFCDLLTPGVNERTWYQAEAFLKIIDGNLTMETLSNKSTPSSVNAEGKGVVRLNRGFAKISSLKWLSLEDNFIEEIQSFVFEGLPGLIHLSLARNRIKYLEQDCFQGLSKLEILNLNHNALISVTSFSINENALPALTHLYVEFNQLQDVSNLCHSNLKYYYLTNNSLYLFQPDSYSSEISCLKNLTHLFLDNNKIVKVIIEEMPLESLSLNDNWMQDIPAIGPQMKFLSMAKNRIEYVRNFNNAKNIVRLILSHNLIDTFYSYQNFQNLTSLEHLALDHNFLTFIPNGFFYNLTSLRSLYLSDNKINNISKNAFRHLPALQGLSLVNNQLTSFPGKESFGQSNLKYLDLSNNKVENISDLQVNMIPKLKILKLSGNPLKRMDPFCSNITILF